jgi:predicted secreted protein
MPTLGIVNATLIGIYVGTTKIANCKSGSLSLSQSFRTSTNKDDLGWEKNLPGARSWSISGDAEFAFDAAYGAEDLVTAINDRTELTLKFSTEVATDMRFTGAAYCESFELSGGAEENASYSFGFKGTGALTKEAVPAT